MTFDEITQSPNLCLVYYLMSSFLYYKLHKSILSDYEFDSLAKILIERWEDVTHRHKDLITLDDLKAGTGYAIHYPNILMQASQQWLKDTKR